MSQGRTRQDIIRAFRRTYLDDRRRLRRVERFYQLGLALAAAATVFSPFSIFLTIPAALKNYETPLYNFFTVLGGLIPGVSAYVSWLSASFLKQHYTPKRRMLRRRLDGASEPIEAAFRANRQRFNKRYGLGRPKQTKEPSQAPHEEKGNPQKPFTTLFDSYWKGDQYFTTIYSANSKIPDNPQVSGKVVIYNEEKDETIIYADPELMKRRDIIDGKTNHNITALDEDESYVFIADIENPPGVSSPAHTAHRQAAAAFFHHSRIKTQQNVAAILHEDAELSMPQKPRLTLNLEI